MNILSTIDAWQVIRAQLGTKTLGLVATMGHLHAGHLSLCQRSRAENDITVVSIFVNPTQFNQAGDFEHYPRTLEQDQALLAAQGVDYVLVPNVADLYPDDYQIQLTETVLSKELEGEFRPGHFNGMLTIVLKLLNLVQAQRAYFGEKDYQQLLLVKKMAASLFLPTDIIGCDTIRAEDGLALSSRNSRLSAAQRQQAAQFPAILKTAFSCDQAIQQLQALGFKVDYIVEQWGRRLGAIWLDDVRLIDNIQLM